MLPATPRLDIARAGPLVVLTYRPRLDYASCQGDGRAVTVREPLGEWIAERWGPERARLYAYDIFGNRRDELHAVRAT